MTTVIPYNNNYIKYQYESDAFILVLGVGKIGLGHMYRRLGRGYWKYKRYPGYETNDWIKLKIKNKVDRLNQELDA